MTAAQCRRRAARWWMPTLVSLWLLACGGAMSVLWSYASRPDAPANPPAAWPADSSLHHAETPTLVMLVHPHCPCSRASLGELARFMTQARVELAAYVLFVSPDGASADWADTDLWDTAATIPGVSAIRDVGGVEAHRFGALTSGSTVLYDANGVLVFNGGITESRGHFGDNAARRAALDALDQTATSETQMRVFGCPLFAAAQPWS